jgi:hypothetical protein
MNSFLKSRIMLNNKYLFLIFKISILLFSCELKDDEIEKVENYKIIENVISKNCTIYHLVYKKAECICRFSLSGPCTNLSVENYVNEYKSYLLQNKIILNNRNGYLIFDHYFNEKKANSLMDSIFYVSNLNLKNKVYLKEKDENSFVIEIKRNSPSTSY